MCDRKQEGPDAREPACMLCHRTEADPDTCGDKLEKFGLCAHVFCLYFATLLPRQENERVGLMGFLPRDIHLAVRRAAQKHCCVCGQSGATILCCEENCGRWFHLPCAKEGGCVTQYLPNYSSYCSEHCPELDMQVTPEPGTECPICLEPVEDRMSYRTMVCPACKRAWFHRDCIQGQAIRAGLLFFKCPLCRNVREFLARMFIVGIRVPFRLPTWEEDDTFADLEERHSQCNARECLYPGGREQAEEHGPWELLLCSSCAAEGTHRRCSGLRNCIESWECDTCAGLGTASRDGPELHGPSLTSQSGLEPPHGSPESEAISPSSHSLLPSGLAPQSPETSRRSSHRHAAVQTSLPPSSLDTSSSSTSGSTYSSSTDPENRVHCRCAGPERRRNGSRQQGRTPNQPIQSRSHRDRSRRAKPRAERRRQRETPSREFPRRSCSRLQRRATSPADQTRNLRDRSHRRTSGTEGPRRRETWSETFPRRSRSRLQHQAQSPAVRSRSHRDRSHRRTSRAERPRRTETPSGPSPRRSRSRLQRQAQSPAVQTRSRRGRDTRTASRADRPRRTETPSGPSPRRSRSRLQRRASNRPVRCRSCQDRSSSTAARADRPRRRGTPSGTSRRSSRARQRHRPSTWT
ncbi:PHD finger protein 7-like [Oenanthe melanoleuca]|uniref:PHD finger protein 7-like n=1 Tax=Oenanthe melanoleuca TaxID=2939378 RepID=UPI0024C1BC9A|nr:PHD finger protein 7-like [Oenanthe melanoleuca]XP_056357370.1 PHD finger protein 7-like [Oenanthe melanoleuca]